MENPVVLTLTRTTPGRKIRHILDTIELVFPEALQAELVEDFIWHPSNVF